MIAKLLWPSSEGDGAVMIDGRERDGVFRTEEMIHVVECTVSNKLEKAKSDCKKLNQLVHELQKKFSHKGIKGYFITLGAVTADQRTESHQYLPNIVALSIEELTSKLIQVRHYIHLREKYKFGSVDFRNNDGVVIKDKFVPITCNPVDQTKRASKIEYSVESLVNKLLTGTKFVITGQYGAGKSMFLREINFQIRDIWQKTGSGKFPIYINLRDHHGQTNPTEALERHARNIGFPNPDHLVRAWRAGLAIMILDGFDEVAPLSWSNANRTNIANVRFKTMELVRAIVRETPLNSGIIISGRANFFDSVSELRKAINLTLSDEVLSLVDFDSHQVRKYLEFQGIRDFTIPDWVPSRPLLLGYLTAKGIFSSLSELQAFSSPAIGWDFLIDSICKREAILEVGLEPETIRQIIESVGSFARRTEMGIGPISYKDLEQIFELIYGSPPDDRGFTMLQRLPGFRTSEEGDGSRYFVDNDFAAIAKAGDVVRFVSQPSTGFLIKDVEKWGEVIEPIGLELVREKISSITPKAQHHAFETCISNGWSAVAGDIFFSQREEVLNWPARGIRLSKLLVSEIDASNYQDSPFRIEFKEIMARQFLIEIGAARRLSSIHFSECMFMECIGISSNKQVPIELFDKGCIFETCELPNQTNDALLEMKLPLGVRIGLTILKKIFLQSGSGRQEMALSRGIDPAYQALVPKVLEILKKEKYIVQGVGGNIKEIWYPVRNRKKQVQEYVYSPNRVDSNSEFFRQLSSLA